MIDWHAIDVEDLQILAAVATRYNLGIAGMIRNLNVLSEEECSLVVAILRQGVGNGESSQQIQRQSLIHEPRAGA